MPNNQQSYSQNHNHNQDFFAILKKNEKTNAWANSGIIRYSAGHLKGFYVPTSTNTNSFFCTGLPVRILK